MGLAGHPDTKRKASESFEKYFCGGTLHPDIRPAVFSIVADSGDYDTYRKFLKIYKKSQSPEEKRQVLEAMGSFKNIGILKKALDFSIGSNVRKQDAYATISSASGNPLARPLLLDWAEKNWKHLESYKRDHIIFLHILEALVAAHVTRDQEKKLRTFFRKHPVEYRMTLAKSFDRVERNILWREKNRKILAEYFGVPLKV
jgi:aminopeptidase N